MDNLQNKSKIKRHSFDVFSGRPNVRNLIIANSDSLFEKGAQKMINRGKKCERQFSDLCICGEMQINPVAVHSSGAPVKFYDIARRRGNDAYVNNT